MNANATKPVKVPIRTILHPTDFSERSALALQLAGALAKDENARLIVLHVETPTVISDEMGPVVVPFPEGQQEALRTQLQAITVPGLAVEHRFEVGDAAQRILDVAIETSCDLIVLGTHGRTGLGRLLLGSIAETIVRKAPCPVLTVRVPFPPASPKPGKKRGKQEQVRQTTA